MNYQNNLENDVHKIVNINSIHNKIFVCKCVFFSEADNYIYMQPFNLNKLLKYTLSRSMQNRQTVENIRK